MPPIGRGPAFASGNTETRSVGLKVLTGHGAAVDTTTAAGKLMFGIFAALAEFERELISERTVAGLASARARGRNGGRPFKMTATKLRDWPWRRWGSRKPWLVICVGNSASLDRRCTGTSRQTASCVQMD